MRLLRLGRLRVEAGVVIPPAVTGSPASRWAATHIRSRESRVGAPRGPHVVGTASPPVIPLAPTAVGPPRVRFIRPVAVIPRTA